MPLLRAGLVRRIIVSSNKQDCDLNKLTICKNDLCDGFALWCPITNEIPNEHISLLLNYTILIYALEVQGRVYKNETVTHFIFQYLNEKNDLATRLFKTDNSISSYVNRFLFNPPIRTNFIKIIPIEFENSIALRLEVYTKGALYNPKNDIIK